MKNQYTGADCIRGDLNKCLRGSTFHLKPVFFFNIFSKDLYFYALIIGLF